MIAVGIVGLKGNLVFDTCKPDGTMRKVMGVSHINAFGMEACDVVEGA